MPYSVTPAADTLSLVQDTPFLDENALRLDAREREVLRRLAEQVAALAARPIEHEKQALWCAHNRLDVTRPVIFCDPENSWHEIIPDESLACSNPMARQWEFRLLRERFWGEQMGDDRTILPYFDVPHVHDALDWGLAPLKIGGEAGGSYRWESPVETEADLERLHFPVLRVDFAGTERLAALAAETFGDLLQVRVRTSWWWTLGMTWTLADLRGLEELMLDMVERPALLHRLMAFLRDGTGAIVDALEAAGLLYPNWEGSYVGSGGLGWSDELPAPDFAGTVRPRDMWGFAESQETVGVSPRMFAEFVLPYQAPLLERFGLNCYGCCEPLDKRWQYVAALPRLRRISVSPWSDRAVMAEALGNRYVYSMKPNPAALALDTFDEGAIRAGLRRDLEATRGCRVEVVMKDNHTIRNDPSRVIRWCLIAREEAERL
jgi:hypothetical protein